MDQTLLADGFEDAFIGYVERCSQPPIAIYDREKAIDVLVASMEEFEEAHT